MDGLSFYGLSIKGILKETTHATDFSPFFSLCGSSQAATIFTFVSDFPVKLLFGRRHGALSYLNTLRTKPFLNTLPNYTLS